VLRQWTADERAGRENIKAFLLVFALAALLYGFRLGNWSLGASEAYSALAASQTSIGSVVTEALRFDPGKPPLYQILLHWFVGWCGGNEASLRAFSVIFALLGLVLLYALALTVLGNQSALIAVIIWVSNPLAVILGQWARMYSMFICTVIASMLTFWNMRQDPGRWPLVIFAVCGTLMLYTHLCGLLFIAVQFAVVTRDFYRGRRTAAPWLGLLVTLALFMPIVPTELVQARGMMFTHWLDWIGAAQPLSVGPKIVAAVTAALLYLMLVFGPSFEKDALEPLRFCLLWLTIPVITFAAVSIVVRPVLAPRYLAPAAPALALLIAKGLETLGVRGRNLSTAGMATAFVLLFFSYRVSRYEPWRDIAQQVGAAGAAQPVFFESGLVVRSASTAAETTAGFDSGFPEGYFRVPFDYYFKGPNPRAAIDPSNPARAREQIAQAAVQSGGAWLVSGKVELTARSEMPNPGQFRILKVLHYDYATLYHIVPMAQRFKPQPKTYERRFR